MEHTPKTITLNQTYQPVSCETHSRYELAILHHQKLKITFWDKQKKHTKTLLPVDLVTLNGSEYLIVEENKKIRKSIRLDHIETIKKLSSPISTKLT